MNEMIQICTHSQKKESSQLFNSNNYKLAKSLIYKNRANLALMT